MLRFACIFEQSSFGEHMVVNRILSTFSYVLFPRRDVMSPKRRFWTVNHNKSLVFRRVIGGNVDWLRASTSYIFFGTVIHNMAHYFGYLIGLINNSTGSMCDIRFCISWPEKSQNAYRSGECHSSSFFRQSPPIGANISSTISTWICG